MSTNSRSHVRWTGEWFRLKIKRSICLSVGNVCFHVMPPEFLGNNSYCRRTDALEMKMCAIVCLIKRLTFSSNTKLRIDLSSVHISICIKIYFKARNLGTVLARLTIRWTVKMKPIIQNAGQIFLVLFVLSIGGFCTNSWRPPWYWTLILNFDVHLQLCCTEKSPESYKHSPIQSFIIAWENRNDVKLEDFSNWFRSMYCKY